MLYVYILKLSLELFFCNLKVNEVIFIYTNLRKYVTILRAVETVYSHQPITVLNTAVRELYLNFVLN
jgi:hypothetical protein